MKKNIYLILLGLIMVCPMCINAEECTGVDCSDEVRVDQNASEGSSGKPGSGYINTNNYQQSNNMYYNAFQIAVKDDKGNVLYSYNVSSSASHTPDSNTVVIPELTTNTVTSSEYIKNMLIQNDGAYAKELINSYPNATNITVEQWHTYTNNKGSSDVWMLDKELMAAGGKINGGVITNYKALLAHMNELWASDGLGWVLGITPQECAALGNFAGSSAVGCGMNIYDLLEICKMKKLKPTNPVIACPNGTMSLSNPTPSCSEKLGGIVANYSYTASSGTQANVHRTYGQDQNAPATGAYCKLFCNEYGIATLPGGIVSPIQLGSYAIWPTSSSNVTRQFAANNYPLKFQGSKACRLVLMPDNGNFPGNGCMQDPVAEYMCIYDASKVSGSKYVCARSRSNSIKHIGLETTDYASVTFEKVRIANQNYFNEKKYCGTKKSTLETLKWEGAYPGSATKYKVEETSQYYNSDKFGKANYTYYKEKVDAINKLADDYKSKCSGLTTEDKKYADMTKEDSSKEECNGNGEKYADDTCRYGSTNVPCWSEAAKSARKKVKDCNDAADAYNLAADGGEIEETTSDGKKVKKYIASLTAEIEGNIDTCEKYIIDFNYAREILNEIGLCGNFSANASDYYHFTSTASSTYTNGEYTVSGNLNKDSDVTYGCQGECSGLSFKEKPDYTTFQSMDTPAILSGKVSQIENRRIIFTADNVVYSSNSDYSYVDKKNNKYSKNKLSSNYLEINTIGGGLAKVLPTDYNTDVVDSKNNAIKYSLSLQNVTFGENGKFNVTNSGDYVCKYEMAKKDTSCVCPQDTNMAGKDLMYYVVNDPISCADAQIKYCDSGDTPLDDVPLYCPDGTSMTACLKTGIGYDACYKISCENGNNEYKCKNSNGLRTGMDITDCVQTKLAQGYNVNQALDYCDSVVCPIGKTIIYRTIKLENPFPSKDADATVTQSGLKVLMFNNNLKGRYPGTNWNGVLTVYNKIRNNRSGSTVKNTSSMKTSGLVGTTIYQTRKPLYTFVLNGVTIKNIRDYNDKQSEGYNDFKLECKKNHSSGCISTFVHNTNLSGLTSGTCQNISLDNGFYTCDD